MRRFRFARARRRPGQMNKLEAAYAAHLELRRKAGDIDAWWFEAVNLRLAPKCFYLPDFMVVPAGTSEVEFHEVKGFCRDDARVKIKVAAAMLPFHFIQVTRAAKKDGGGWRFETISPDEAVPERVEETRPCESAT